MINKNHFPTYAVAITFFATGCYGPESPVVIEPTLESIQQNIFNVNCVKCHGAENPIHGADYSEGRAYDSLVYKQSFMEPDYNLVEPGDPDNSLLVQKLENTAVTAYMPFLGFLLHPSKVEVVREWILNLPLTPQPTLRYVQKNVFDKSCATSSCHDDSTSAAGLNLSIGSSLVSLADVPSTQSTGLDLVEPGDPNNSYLIQKLEGTANSTTMPLGQALLPQAEIDAVRGWISTLTGPQPTLAWLQTNVFDVSCAYLGCHDSITSAKNLDLTTLNILAETVEVPSIQAPTLNLIEPGNPDDSYLVHKLENSQTTGRSMPWRSPQLSAEKITAVRNWILSMQPLPDPVQPTLESIQASVFDVSCATGGCHDNTTQAFNLDLSDGNAYASIVNIGAGQSPQLDLIEPGDPDNSYLIKKLEGSGAGSIMPQGQAPLSQDTINAIRDWALSL